MSEDKRQTVRTQGRFSNDKEAFHSRDKGKQKGKKSSKVDKCTRESENVRDQASGSKLQAECASIEYQEDSKVSFKDLEKKKFPEELRFKGFKQISETKNGISSLIYEPNLFDEEKASNFLEILHHSTKWHEKNIIIHGQEYPQPRLVAWYGPLPYEYSGAVLEPANMPECVLQIKQSVENCLSKHNVCVDLNSVLLNLYRDHKDSVAWHCDDEMSMGICPTIASVSLGTVRKFEMRPKLHTIEQKSLDPKTVYYVNLVPGSLIIMDGCMQKDWQHRVPKEFHDKGPRINLTFRTVYPIDRVPRELPHVPVSENASTFDLEKPRLEHKYDSDNFPSLMSVTNLKNKKYEECKDLNENQSPNKSNGHQSLDENLPTLQDKSEMHEDQEIEHNSFVETPQSVNNIVMQPDLNSYEQSCCESFQTHSAELENKPILSPKDDESYEAEDFIQNQNYNPSGLPSGIRKKTASSKLNARAREFVPHNVNNPVINDFSSFSLYNLGKLDPYAMSIDEMDSFISALIDKLQREKRGCLFRQRDWIELDVLCEISDGSQSEKNQKLILNRICSLIRHVENIARKEYRNYPQSQENRYPQSQENRYYVSRENMGPRWNQTNKRSGSNY